MERFNQFSTLENDFENQNLVMFDVVIHNFGKSYSDISEKIFISTIWTRDFMSNSIKKF